jgi:phosphopentomutase
MGRRAFVIVLDACGAGELPDSADYGDAGSNTLGHVAEACGGLELPNLQALGLGAALALRGCPPPEHPALHGRLHPLGPGKDTITGHWELMGAVTPVALRTYPDGFPPDVIEQLRDASGRGILCNQPYSGTAVIDDFGEEHIRTGDLIVYTSADSVLQIAAHDREVPAAELYAACAAAREIMRGEHAVGRVIARPFDGEPGAFRRTEGRKDFALDPPGRSYLDELRDAGMPVHTVGKIGSVFNHVGVDHEHPGATNPAAIAETTRLMEELDAGLVFSNLVETDQVYGHRQDVPGFHRALQEIDVAVGEWLARTDPANDLLVITADHGCDPTTPGTDHSREHVPLLARFEGDGGRRHDGPFADVGASVLRWLAERDAPGLPGASFIQA